MPTGTKTRVYADARAPPLRAAFVMLGGWLVFVHTEAGAWLTAFPRHQPIAPAKF